MINIYNISALNKSIALVFPKGMFWDVDMKKLSIDFDKNFIIQRVLSRSKNKVAYLESLESFYPKKDIINLAINSPEIIGNEKIEFISKRYNIEPKKFMSESLFDEFLLGVWNKLGY